MVLYVNNKNLPEAKSMFQNNTGVKLFIYRYMTKTSEYWSTWCHGNNRMGRFVSDYYTITLCGRFRL